MRGPLRMGMTDGPPVDAVRSRVKRYLRPYRHTAIAGRPDPFSANSAPRSVLKCGAAAQIGAARKLPTGQRPRRHNHRIESLSGCIPRSLLRASGLLPCCPNTPQLAAGIFYTQSAILLTNRAVLMHSGNLCEIMTPFDLDMTRNFDVKGVYRPCHSAVD